MKNRKIASFVAVAALAACQAASAASWTAEVGGSALPGYSYENFDGSTFSMGVIFTPDAAQVSGAASGLYAAPWVSGYNNQYFYTGVGDVGAVGFADGSKYLTTGSSGAYPAAKIVMTFANPQSYLGLLWGSIDWYNTITFKDKDGKAITFIDKDGNTANGLTGADIMSPNAATGYQGLSGTAYVNIWTGAEKFTSVEFTSTQYAFEFDNVACTPDAGASLSLLGMAIMGLGIYGRKFGAKA